MMIPRLKRLHRGIVTAVLAGAVVPMQGSYAQEKDLLELDKIPTLKTKFPKAAIDKWTREKEGDFVVYDIEFNQAFRGVEPAGQQARFTSWAASRIPRGSSFQNQSSGVFR